MRLTGKFEPFFLSSILQLICNEKRTGVLRLMNKDNNIQIIIRNGTVVYALGSQKDARLGNIIKKMGLIKEDVLEECLAEAGEKKLALGRVLVERKLVPESRLKQIIKGQIEELIINMFLWNSGDFEYNDAKLNLSGLIIIELNIMNIILSASRRIDEVADIRKQIPNNGVIFQISKKMDGTLDIALNEIERLIFLLIDGQRNVQQIINKSEESEYTIHKILYGFFNSNIVEIQNK